MPTLDVTLTKLIVMEKLLINRFHLRHSRALFTEAHHQKAKNIMSRIKPVDHNDDGQDIHPFHLVCASSNFLASVYVLI